MIWILLMNLVIDAYLVRGVTLSPCMSPAASALASSKKIIVECREKLTENNIPAILEAMQVWADSGEVAAAERRPFGLFGASAENAALVAFVRACPDLKSPTEAAFKAGAAAMLKMFDDSSDGG